MQHLPNPAALADGLPARPRAATIAMWTGGIAFAAMGVTSVVARALQAFYPADPQVTETLKWVSVGALVVAAAALALYLYIASTTKKEAAPEVVEGEIVLPDTFAMEVTGSPRATSPARGLPSARRPTDGDVTSPFLPLVAPRTAAALPGPARKEN